MLSLFISKTEDPGWWDLGPIKAKNPNQERCWLRGIVGQSHLPFDQRPPEHDDQSPWAHLTKRCGGGPSGGCLEAVCPPPTISLHSKHWPGSNSVPRLCVCVSGSTLRDPIFFISLPSDNQCPLNIGQSELNPYTTQHPFLPQTKHNKRLYPEGVDLGITAHHRYPRLTFV